MMAAKKEAPMTSRPMKSWTVIRLQRVFFFVLRQGEGQDCNINYYI
jgi:hypothetical protein